MYYDVMNSFIGDLLLAADDQGLRTILFTKDGKAPEPQDGWIHNPEKLAEIRHQLEEYMDGKRTRFDIPLAPEGTTFQSDVWHALCEIPYGEVISYQVLAQRVGRPKAVRAVGAANGRNPIPIVIPCHRVIGSNGKLTGYAGGLDIKEKLIGLEQGGFLNFGQ